MLKHKELFIHFIFLFAIFAIVFSPIIKHAYDSPKDSYYPFIQRDPPTYYSYLSYVRQGNYQPFLISQQEITNQPIPRMTHIYYLLLGKIGGFLNIPVIPTYYFGLILPLIIFYFFNYLIVSVSVPASYKWFTMFLIYFASPFPKQDINVFGQKLTLTPEWWTFQDIYSRMNPYPHHFISFALISAATYFLLKYLKTSKIREILFLGICLNLALFFYVIPAAIFLSVFLITLFILLAKKVYLGYKMKKSLLSIIFRHKVKIIVTVLILLMSIFIMYIVNKETGQSDIISWESQFDLDHNRPLLTLIYRFFIPFGILPFFIPLFLLSSKKNVELNKVFIAGMIIIPFTLFTLASKGHLYIASIRFLSFPAYLYFSLLTVYGIIYFINLIKSKILKKTIFFLIVFTFMINSIIGLKSYWWPEVTKKEIYLNTYIPEPFLKAMNYLDTYSTKHSNVMTTYAVGMFIPPFTHNRVYMGHEATNNLPVLWWSSQNLMQGNLSEENARKLLTDNKISYVLWYGSNFPLSYFNFLKPVFNYQYVTVYKTSF